MADDFEKRRKKEEDNNLNIRLEKAEGGTIVHGLRFGDKSEVVTSVDDLKKAVDSRVNKFMGVKTK
jgi:hypothetical protein